MSLIKSISGIRGTIGGEVNDGLNPISIAKFTAAYATFIRANKTIDSNKIVVGRDARISGEMVKGVVIGTLSAMGFDVVDLDLSSTPTTELAVVYEAAAGGIIITASHNPRHWNALKLLNHRGEFLNAQEGEELIRMVEKEDFEFADVDHIGEILKRNYTKRHAQDVARLPQVDVEAIKAAEMTVVVDCINSVGSIIVEELLSTLGVSEVVMLNAEPNGDFAHNPEPLPINLVDLSQAVRVEKAHVGFAVDPDVDRLAIVCEDGEMFGEENTLVAIADYLLDITPGVHTTVSNLSSSRALKDITLAHGGAYYPANVGEVNVVTKMKEVNALIGGEGNGGVIFPTSHYGRDAMVGIALFLTIMAKKSLKPSQIKTLIPEYHMTKTKVVLPEKANVDELISQIKGHFSEAIATTTDGLKLDFPQSWVHIRKSNTEPIVRIYAEARSKEESEKLANEVSRLFTDNQTK